MRDNAPPPPEPVKKGGNFLTADTAGIPNWVWGIILLAGIGAALIIPKLFSSATGTQDATTPASNPLDTSGLTNGGSLASGGTTDYSAQINQLQATLGDVEATLSNLEKAATTTPNSGGHAIPPPAPPVHYITIGSYPGPLSTLNQIASKYGVSVQRLLQLNPQIKNPDKINAGQQLRIA